MVQNKNLLSAIILSGTLAVSGCTLSKMVKLSKDQQLTVTPSPLELHGDSVKFNMSALLPVKMLKKNTTYTVNNTYKYGTQRAEVGSAEFKATDFPNAKKEQPKVEKNFSFAYTDAMQRGELVAKGVATKKTKSKETPELPLALGIITTSRLVRDANVVAYAEHGYNTQPEFEPTSVEFYFLKGSSVLRPTETKSGRGKFLDAFIAEKNVTKTVTITGSHSPEGEETINSKLSEQRAKVIESYYKGRMKRFDYKKKADSIEFITKAIVQDWTMFKDTLAANTTLSQAQKDEVLAIVDGGSGDFVEKEKQLHGLSSYKKLMDDVYPKLRTAGTEILSMVEKKPDNEIAVLAKQIAEGSKDAKELNDKELAYAASLTPDMNEKVAIYEALAKKSDTWLAHNNLAATQLEIAKKETDQTKKTQLVDAATTHLEQAKNKQETAEIYNNLAVAYSMKGQKTEAQAAIDKAATLGGGEEVTKSINSAKGIQQIKAANYAQAVSTLSSAGDNSDVLYNKGLAQILNKEYDKALATLTEATNANPEDAGAYYLAAIASARSKNETQLATTLSKAISLNSELRAKALEDLEFNSYANSENFKNAVK